jgi:hypothetical protein
MDGLDFITDASLRKTVGDSIEYTYLLFEESKRRTDNKLYQEETCRVIVLYVVSIIEAILLFFYKKGGYQIPHIDYKYVEILPEKYTHMEASGDRVVVAIQKRGNKEEFQIGLKSLADFLESQKLISKRAASEILAINNLRNTFHLSKPRGKIACGVRQVERALKLLVYIIERSPKGLLKKATKLRNS